MLVFSRKEGESFVIGDTIFVTVVRISPTTVRLGIEAPVAINVHREEVYRSIQKQNLRFFGIDPAAPDALVQLRASLADINEAIGLKIVRGAVKVIDVQT